MEDYEIDDVRNRRLATQGELSVSVEASQGILMQFVVANLGSVVLRNITFEVPSELLPLLKSPNVFTRGIRELQPRKRYTLNWGTYLNLTAETSSHPTVFDITATYNVGLASELSSDVFHIDLQDYWNTAVERSDLDRLGETLKKSVDDLTGEVRRLVQHAERLTRIAAPTGMSLSVTALRNLRHVLSGDDAFERLAGAEPETLMEVLDVEPRLAVELAKFLRARGKVGRLEDVEGMTPELLAAVRSQFKL
jgi:hypothetical protein